MPDHLVERVARIAAEFSGRLGVAGKNLCTEERVEYQADLVLPTASMIKLAVQVELMRHVEAGRRRLDDVVEVREEDRVEGSGVLRHLGAGLRLPIRDLAFLMMNVSDNVATNMLIDTVGIDNVNRMLRAERLDEIELRHRIDFDHCWGDPRHLAVGTPRAFAELLERVYRGTIVSPASRDEMLRTMAGVGAERLGRYLPLQPYADDLRKHGYPAGPTLRIAGKTGGLIGVRGHVAVVSGDGVEFIVAAMTDGSRDTDWGVENDAVLALAQVGKLLHNAWAAPC
ncbi:MAG: serine hydrolase [Chloroflexi bacterium]|nr:serine hydrolase [Chloroflexota bacterium]